MLKKVPRPHIAEIWKEIVEDTPVYWQNICSFANKPLNKGVALGVVASFLLGGITSYFMFPHSSLSEDETSRLATQMIARMMVLDAVAGKPVVFETVPNLVNPITGKKTDFLVGTLKDGTIGVLLDSRAAATMASDEEFRSVLGEAIKIEIGKIKLRNYQLQTPGAALRLAPSNPQI